MKTYANMYTVFGLGYGDLKKKNSSQICKIIDRLKIFWFFV